MRSFAASTQPPLGRQMLKMAKKSKHAYLRTRDQLLEYANNGLVFYGIDLSRVSTKLISQIYEFELARAFNIHGIGDELKMLEDGTSKKVGVFKHLPLKGLYKAHFFDARFIKGNLDAHFGFSRGGNKRLDQVIQEALDGNKSGYDDEFCAYLAHNLPIGAIEARAQKGKLSGEWIIFQRYNDKNYYLLLASHSDGDENIYKKVRAVYDTDFPFLREKCT